MNLPLYSKLRSASNAVYYADAGVKGIIVFNTGSGYNAFDAACPNQELSSCSTMTINGINAVCPCDSKEYLLFTGQPLKSDATTTYPMKQYRVQVNGDVIHIYN
ncbi:hypothetical protein [Flavobacterium sp.]|uniref:Rieske (2Fe-2S) protein n=1 Tax=Flavobacterium sp. TaxID=239 RepID=UPI002B69DFE9|nr:hypothetical protein [Flavobacterium sp.]HSD06279.1 hypothetical protein [Flavobacterium sp.]